MRTFKTSLFMLIMAAPAVAFAQDVSPDEEPAAQAPAEDAAPAAEPEAPAASASASVSLSNASATTTAATPPAAEERPAPPRTRGGPETGGSWEFGYHGYFRAPMRVGMGARHNRMCDRGAANTYNEAYPVEPYHSSQSCVTTGQQDALDGQSATTFHSPVIPDDQYLSWQSTSHNRRDWAEMFFSVGNGTVSGNLAIQAFHFTDSSWPAPKNQFGIGQGWVEINSDLGYENIKFNAKAGSHWNRYGMAGRYDAGEFDTYLFGRTHAVGATSRIDVDLGGSSIGFEAGLGTHRPDPEDFNRTRFTMLGHGHVFFTPADGFDFSAHILHAWSSSEAPTGQQNSPLTGNTPLGPNDTATGGPDLMRDGKQTVFGVDGRLDFAQFGSLYAGWSYMKLSDAITVAPAIEAIHSFGGGEFNSGAVDNYLETPFCQKQNPIQTGTCSGGNGSINTLLGQYEVSLSNFDVFEGNQDLRFKLYGMLNFVSSDDKGFLSTEPRYAALAAAAGGVDNISQDGVTKVKFGLDTEFIATSWLSAGLRADHLRPNSKIAEQNFTIVSPRITFHSDFVTREQISFQYSRYIYAQRECEVGNPAANPFQDSEGYAATNAAGLPGRVYCVQPPPSAVTPDGWSAHTANQSAGTRGAPTYIPDINVFKIEASMWW